MRILLVGRGFSYEVGTFFERALKKMDADFVSIDMRKYYKASNKIFDKIVYRFLGNNFLIPLRLNREILSVSRSFKPDIVIIIKGPHIYPETLYRLKRNHNSHLVNYATDDPFNPLNSTKLLLKAIPFYDLYACTKMAIMDDVREAGCKNITFLPFAYDPSSHYPEPPQSKVERDRFSCDVAFIGGGDSDRRELLGSILSHKDIKLAVYGSIWDRYPEFRSCYRGLAIGRDFRLAHSCAKIVLGLVRHANRDGHSMRTFEIPACGAFMLAERTDEHLMFFSEGLESVYFSEVGEFKDKIKYYLHNVEIRRVISEAGYMKVKNHGNSYSDRLSIILDRNQQRKYDNNN